MRKVLKLNTQKAHFSLYPAFGRHSSPLQGTFSPVCTTFRLRERPQINSVNKVHCASNIYCIITFVFRQHSPLSRSHSDGNFNSFRLRTIEYLRELSSAFILRTANMQLAERGIYYPQSSRYRAPIDRKFETPRPFGKRVA